MDIRRGLLDSFKYAVKGIIYSFKTQRNMKIHTAAAVLVSAGAIVLSMVGMKPLPRSQVISLVFAISLVIICEMINTAIEKTVDVFTEEFHPLAQIAKDVAAGAVLVSAANAIIIGILVFWP